MCRAPLAQEQRHGALRPACAACGFVQFHDPKVAVVALVTQGDSVLLIRRGVPPAQGQWALPGGFMDAGESPEEALAREVQEEAGIVVQVGALLAIHPLMVDEENRGVVLAFAVNAADQCLETTLIAGDDVTDARWFRYDALPAKLAFASTQALLAQWAARRTMQALPQAALD
jgi:ADP-ribose pyrophosphatase YjhB (NUDIX family)